MSFAQNPIVSLPTDAPLLPICDLYSDEPPLETDLHLQQIILLLECLNWSWQDRNDFYASANSTIYFSEKQLKHRDFRGSDFFVVLGVERRPRKSWVVWAEEAGSLSHRSRANRPATSRSSRHPTASTQHRSRHLITNPSFTL